MRKAAWLLAALLFTMPGGAAFAADQSDVVGTWSVDTAALRERMAQMVEQQLANMPAAQQARARMMMAAQLDQMVASMAGRADFRADGSVEFTSPNEEASSGTWSLEDDVLRFQRDERAPGEPAYVGTVEGDVIEVQPQDAQSAFQLTLRRD